MVLFLRGPLLMKYLLLFFSLFFSLFSTHAGYSQVALNPVKWEYSYEKLNDKEGYVLIKAKIDKDWHIYSQHQPGDGPIPTSFVFNANSDFEPLNKTEEPAAEKTHSEVFSADVISFSNEVVFKQKIKRKNPDSFNLNAELEFMACNNSSCLPPKVIKFSVIIPAAVPGK